MAVKGCDSLFSGVKYFFQILKVAINEPCTLHYTICTWIALEMWNNEDQTI